VYATGRHRDSARSAIVSESLPPPDAVISAVGTEIHDGAGRPFRDWFDRLDRSHGERVRTALRPLRWLEPQSDENQTDLKSSYDVRGMTPADASAIRRALMGADVQATLTYSGGVHLDVIPILTGKGLAARFLAELWGIPYSAVFAFGDSGNDLDLLSAGFRGTIVANALPELRSEAPFDVYRSARPFADGVLDGIRYWSER
jgi:hydroxymethylpyrimidine pyrophosphatase-like HAD family hydrolase